MIKGPLRLFIERIVVEANRIRIIGKTGMVLAMFKQKMEVNHAVSGTLPTQFFLR